MPLVTQGIIEKMDAIMQKGTTGADIVKKVKAIYWFEIREKKGAKPTFFTIDLKNGNGKAQMGKIDGVKADCTFVMLDSDFNLMSQGKLDGNTAFMQGKMKIKGNMQAAMKFTPDVLPKDAKL